MTEPVAYIGSMKDGSLTFTKNRNPQALGSTPLYTVEQLHQRVKMTQEQYDRLMFDKENTDLSACLEYFIKNDGNNDFGLPSEKLLGNLTQEDIAIAWLNPEETIEIVPTKKWFVRSKKSDNDGYWDWLVKYVDHGLSPEYNSDNDIPSRAVKFDTREDAERWASPLTEAVQLPVEDE